MASIDLINASVEFPIYNARGRSIRRNILARVGGTVAADGDVVSVRALKDVNLSLREGDRLGVLGHNGAGKSTLLRVLSGAYEPSSGEARIEGAVSSLLDITMGMDPEMSGAENIILRGALIGMSIREAKESIADIGEFAEIGDFLDLPMRTYSSGMNLRLAFAISTAIRPDILLMDELVSVGDSAFAKKARQRIRELIENAGILVLASHDPKTLLEYCNRGIVMRHGSVVFDGAIEEAVIFHHGKLPDDAAAPAGGAPPETEASPAASAASCAGPSRDIAVAGKSK